MSQRICSVDGCEKPVKSRGWCNKHYTRWYETGSLDLGVRTNPRPTTPLAARFWAKVDKSGECWHWTGGKTALGYGMVWSGRPESRHLMAHRVAWEMSRGSIPEGMHIDHLCRNPSCVNPDHLEPVTVAENTRRGYAPSIGAAFQLSKTHCPKGHPYDEANTYVNRPGSRVCRACGREYMRARRAAKRNAKESS